MVTFVLALFFAAALGVALYRLVVPQVVMQMYRAELPHHRFDSIDPDHQAGTTEVFYLGATFDCRSCDLVVDGVAPPSPYWMIGIYDRWAWGIPGGHLNLRTVRLSPEGRFRVRVTARPTGAANELDCSSAREGILVVRALLPTGPVETPRITEEPLGVPRRTTIPVRDAARSGLSCRAGADRR